MTVTTTAYGLIRVGSSVDAGNMNPIEVITSEQCLMRTRKVTVFTQS